jgi:hypothetical protein
MVEHRDVAIPETAAHGRTRGPPKGFASVHSEINQRGKFLNQLELPDGKIWVSGEGLPVIHISQATNWRSLDFHPAGKQVINQQHAIDTESTTLGQSCGSQEAIRVRLTHFEVSFH